MLFLVKMDNFCFCSSLFALNFQWLFVHLHKCALTNHNKITIYSFSEAARTVLFKTVVQSVENLSHKRFALQSGYFATFF